MNPLQQATRQFIKASFDLSVSTIEFFNTMEPYYQQVDQLRQLEQGTLGRAIADCLDAHQLTLVPHFESHDLKHVLLDYKMTAEGEIRLQAFMLGNGNHSLPAFAIFLFGAVLLPELWPVFYADFQKGRRTLPISTWTLEEYAHQPLEALRTQLAISQQQPTMPITLQQFTQFAALLTIAAGLFGMIFCLPFLFSSKLADLVGAGFPFVGGAILVVGGLLTLSNLARHAPQPMADW